MENEFIILKISYPDDKDINISMMRDDLNNKKIIKGLKDRQIDIEYKEKGSRFHATLLGYDGEIEYESNKYNSKFFKNIFNAVDGLPTRKTKDDFEVLETKTLALDLPSDDEMEEMEEEVSEIEALDDQQEIDDQPIGVTYMEDGVRRIKRITKEDYLKMKNKYLNIKKRVLDKL